jgi:hypothetical protein
VTISTYHVEGVLKAYSKQTRAENSIRREAEGSTRYTDVVTLSSGGSKKEVFERISYSLLDILLKKEKSA